MNRMNAQCENVGVNTTNSLEIQDQYVTKAKNDILKKINVYEDEIHRLKDQLRVKYEMMEKNSVELVVLERKNNKAVNNLKPNEALKTFEKAMWDYMEECKKINDFHNSIKNNLVHLEMTVEQVIGKYEKAKNTIAEYKINERALKENIKILIQNLKTEGQRYETLKQTARTQLEKAKKQNNWLKQYLKQKQQQQQSQIDDEVGEASTKKYKQKACTLCHETSTEVYGPL